VAAGAGFAVELDAPVVKSKKGDVKLRLDSGPKGMKLEEGKLSWFVPATLSGREVDASLAVTDSSGREVLHPFKLEVRAK
jgi:hypothetical protein